MSNTTPLSLKEETIKATAPRPCSDIVPIIPFRYALMPKKIKEKSEKTYYSKCPTSLDKDFDHLETAAYTVRTLRPGYIYAYDEELDTTYLWEADGDGNYTSLTYKNLEEYNKISNHGSKTQSLDLQISKDSRAVYIAFSQDLWSKKGEKSNIAQRDKFMTKFDILEFVNSSGGHSTQKHILPSDAPEEWIEEYKVNKDDYTHQFGWSCHHLENITSMSVLKTKAISYAEEKRSKLPVFMVLYDNLAVARDQGNIATQYMHRLSEVKASMGDPKNIVAECKQTVSPLPFEMFLDTSKIGKTSEDFHRKKVISLMITSVLQSSYPTDAELKKDGSSVKNLQEAIEKAKIQEIKKRNARGRITSKTIRTAGDNEALVHALADDDINEDVNRVTKHINMEALIAFTQELDEENKRLKTYEQKALKASKDHCDILITMHNSLQNHPRNLVSTLNTYDRENIFSANALENVIAFAIMGMGIPVPNNLDIDERFKLINDWLDDESSPIYLGLYAYQSEEIKQLFDLLEEEIEKEQKTHDSLKKNKVEEVFVDTKKGDVGNAIKGIVERIHKKYPYGLGTEIIVNEIRATTFKKINGKARWNKSAAIQKNVRAALAGTSLKRVMTAIEGRYSASGQHYKQVGETTSSVITSKSLFKLINLDVGDHATRHFDLKGNRTSTLINTTTTTKTTENLLSKAVGELKNSGMPVGIAFIHGINLYQAIISFNKSASLSNSVNMASALLGVTGALNEVTQLALQRGVGKKLATRVVGKNVVVSFTSVATRIALNNAFGYAGAFLEVLLGGIDAYQASGRGDTDAAVLSLTKGLLIGGSVLAFSTAGALAIAGAAGVVPIVGWFVAGIVLLGAGLFAAYRAIVAKDTPHEIWISRTYFGKTMREGLLGFGDVAYTPFGNLSEELSGYYSLTFSPILIDKPDEDLFLTEEEKKMIADAGKLDSMSLSIPRHRRFEIQEKRKAIKLAGEQARKKQVIGTEWVENSWNKDKVRYTFLLPAFNPKLSDWTYTLNNYKEDDVESPEDIEKATLLESKMNADNDKMMTHQKDEGMYVYLEKIFNNSDAQSAVLNVKYWPNGHSREAVTQNFYLDD